MKKILFITPYFGRSGSEMQLLYILQNLDTNAIKPYLFSKDNGVLTKALPKNIPFSVGYKQHPNFLFKLLRLLLYAFTINPVEFQLRLIQKKFKADYWYINSLANRDAYEIAHKLGIKVISHIHELPLAYGLFKYKTLQKAVLSSLCIGCSRVVCEKLRDMGHQNVQLLYGFVNEENICLTEKNEEIRNEFNFTETDFVWIISGNTSTIKGIDYLIPLLKELPNRHKIIWIGHKERIGAMFYTEQAVAHYFSDRVFFVGKKDIDYYNYFNLGHAFLSISREDSFPLVMIEAAHLGMPIAGFNSGGIKEFVNKDLGVIVDQLNFKELANAMDKMANEYAKYDKAKIKSYAKSFNAKTQVQKLTKIIEANT
ncbi:glycosyltransferase family 4 protein [Pedobacter insulae]|uniref:Glycosyltransferase involved in cell wall bisynthesis n=1 Tax=Pedobacter insulae TaxID=414048 RepID=A0A1I2YS52_9SPHI|nr:glycosyltransferase family 4 protein [Pedobacter insulae]SFH28290.1 Glycosyltransferase involved in cell wall bisynthesis [Pedobacter insulae]